MSLACWLGIVAIAALLILYYDYRYRTHWSGYTFGYPLKGFARQVFLTFDDGPSGFGRVLKGDDDGQSISDPTIRRMVLDVIPEYDFTKTSTENLLALLVRHDVKAIFFVLGQSITSHAHAGNTLRKIASQGHIVGNHSFSHDYARKQESGAMLDDFACNHELIQTLTGQATVLFRPPYGDWEPDMTKRFLKHPALRDYLFPIFWTDMFREWALESTAQLGELESRLEGFRRSCRDGQGKILLLHDIYLSSVLLTAMILKEVESVGYVVGDPATLMAAVSRETGTYKRFPFLYYLKILGLRVRRKLRHGVHDHTNYRMEQPD